MKIETQEMKLKDGIEKEWLITNGIGAICEPSMKTETQSWLEYYNQQVLDLRQMLAKI